MCVLQAWESELPENTATESEATTAKEEEGDPSGREEGGEGGEEEEGEAVSKMSIPEVKISTSNS